MTSVVGIAGVTGKLGRCILRYLLHHGDIRLRGFCRDSSKVDIEMRNHERIQIIQGDPYDAAVIDKLVRGTDVIICTYLGPDDFMYQGQRALIDACERHGTPRYVASDYTFDYTRLQYSDHPGKDPMMRIKDYLDTKERVKGVHILVGALMETFWSSFFDFWNPVDQSFKFWGTGDEMWEMTSYENAGAFTAAIALNQHAVGIQRYIGDRKSTKEIAKIFKETTGITPQLRSQGTIEDLYKLMHQLRDNNPDDLQIYLNLFYHYWMMRQLFVLPDGVDGEKSPLVPRVSVRDFLSANPIESLPDAMKSQQEHVSAKSTGSVAGSGAGME